MTVHMRFTPDNFIVGSMMFGLRSNLSDIKSIISRASELGIVEYDSSPSYIGGLAQDLLAQALSAKNSTHAIVHSKVGRQYDTDLAAGGVYLSHYHIDNAIEKIQICFSKIQIGQIQVHVYDCHSQLMSAFSYLSNCYYCEKIIKGVGVSNINNKVAARLINDCVMPDAAMTPSLQRRFAIGLAEEAVPQQFTGWAYGVLNAGSFITDKSLEGHSPRLSCGLDKSEINIRQAEIRASSIYRRASNACLMAGIQLADYAIAYPLLSGYSKVIIGPTRHWHLDSIARLLNPSHSRSISELHNDVVLPI